MKHILTFASVIFFCLTAISATQAQTKPITRTSQTVERGYNPQRAKAIGAGKAKYEFRNSRSPGQIDRVKVELKVGGEVIDVVDKKEHREKLSVQCNLDYEEKTLQVSTSDENLSRSVRYYRLAEATEKIGEYAFNPVLRPDRGLIAVEISSQKPLLFCPNGTLTRDELELIDVQGNSLLLDRFLPDKPMAVGDTWQPSEEFMAQLLGLDEVGQTDVKSELKEIADDVARFEMKGNVAGAAEGVTTAIEIKARYRYDLKRKRLDWLGMVVKERRQVSPVSDGLDVTAQLRMQIVPAEKTEHLDEADLMDLPQRSTPELTRLSHASKEGGWEIAYDRNWYVNRNQKGLAAAVLRRIEQGDVIGQCNVSALSPVEPDKLVSREKYQEDIRHALDKDFQEFIEAGQTVDKANRRVLRVVVRGQASELPILWTYYHIADQQGRQMSFAFITEEKFAERFGKADQELVDSLRFIEPKR
ncbi:MAG: hypothetical protein ABSA26_08555 [Thermoguttaceae bacterium]